MNNRNYNKLYVSKNRNDFDSKIVVGYQIQNSDILFKKDQETYFHIPLNNTYSIPVSSSLLIENGATGGPFPAASDIIFQSRKNYAATTNNGTLLSSTINGMWFCTWLYKDNYNNYQWMDRFYDPGKFSSDTLINSLYYPPYTVHNPIFQDTPSTLKFEPGVLYKYKHIGENTLQKLVENLNEGKNKEKYLIFNLKNWGTSQIDASNNKLNIIVSSEATSAQLYPTLSSDAVYVNKNPISFNHSENVNCYSSWSEDITVEGGDFSLSFWAKSDDWSNSPTTQLVGNYSSKGGFGLFVDNLSSYPFFAIPETYYGHLLIINEDGVGITDRLLSVDNNQFKTQRVVCIDTNNDIICCQYKNEELLIEKINHLGVTFKTYKMNQFGYDYESATNSDLLWRWETFKCINKPIVVCDNGFQPPTTNITWLSASNGKKYNKTWGETACNVKEVPVGMLCGRDNDIWLVSNLRVYHFDTNLELLQTIPRKTSETSTIAFSSNPMADTYNLVINDEQYAEMRFNRTDKWTINKEDNNLYKNNQLYYQFETPATTFQFDPYGNIWVLHGNNEVTVIDPEQSFSSAAKMLEHFNVGPNKQSVHKTITFFRKYKRKKASFEWRFLIHYANEPFIYIGNLNGEVIDTLNLENYYQYNTLQELGQLPTNFEYLGKGDVTGYEHRRVFKNLSPINNKQRLILKISAQDLKRTANDFGTFSHSISIDQWSNKSWKHITVTHQNRQFKLYINGILQGTATLPFDYELNMSSRLQWFFGSPVGFSEGWNKEIGKVSSIFNGYLNLIKFYSRSLQEYEIQLLVYSNIIADDITWSVPTPKIHCLEKFDRMFKHKLPGSKSSLYKVKLHNFDVADPVVRNIIEEQIKTIIIKNNPGHTDFVSIDWG